MEFQASDPKQPYRPLMRLAAGGMGQVEVSTKIAGSFQRIYAVKRLKDELLHDESARSMFLDEARLAGLVRHPNVVSVIDVGVDKRGPYLVMDFVEGLSCGGLIRKTMERAELLPVQFCLRIALQTALGLHSAHELCDSQGQSLGLVHRDVSPQNILIGFDGVVRLTDFGIAKAIGRSTETTTHLLKGKMGYMSPEQLRFEEPDRRSDLFSFGVVLYELLSAQRLYREESPAQTARRILNEPPPDIDDVRFDVPPSIVHLLFSLLAKDPEDRPPNARAVAETLDEAISDLVAGEGREDSERYMREHFEDEATDLRNRLDDAVTTMERSDESRTRKRTLGRGGAALAAFALVGTLGVAATLWGGSSDAPVHAEPASVAGAPSDPLVETVETPSDALAAETERPEPVAETESAEPVAETEVAETEVAETEVAETEVAETEVVETGTRSTAAARRRRQRRAAQRRARASMTAQSPEGMRALIQWDR